VVCRRRNERDWLRVNCKRPECTRVVHRSHLCRGHYKQHLAKQPSGIVSAEPARQHILELRATGLSLDSIAYQAGVSRVSTLSPLLAGQRTTLRSTTAERVLSVPVPDFPQLDGTYKLIPAIGSQRRVQALMAIGYRAQEIQVMVGLSPPGMSLILNGRNKLIRVELAERFDQVFRRCELHPRKDRRAILRAQRNNWPPPLFWDSDTIDDPDAEPYVPEVIVDEWHDDFRELCSMGLSQRHAAERMGIKWSTLQRRLERLRAAA
jgi:hypothetical protein